MEKILIAGGTGFIGRKLADMLHGEGYSVSLLSRNPTKMSKYRVFGWDPINGKIDLAALQNIDIIINLAGSGIARWPWTRKRKLSVYNSRILSTRLLVDSISKQDTKPSHFISVSAIGYYGNRPDEILTEKSMEGTGFLSRVCRDWENEVLHLKNQAISLTVLRLGIVLSLQGGSLPVLLMPFRYRLNVLFGKGLHTISWIHIDDLLEMFSGIVNKTLLPGLYNAVSPNPVSQAIFNKGICQGMGRKTITIKLPVKMLEIFAGELASVMTNDQNISPTHLMSQDFRFKFPEIKGALKDFL
jgi:uncharacterized protein (TIGR01777 family)